MADTFIGVPINSITEKAIPASGDKFIIETPDGTRISKWGNIESLMNSGIKGTAITTTVPSATAFERYLVYSAGTYTNFKSAGNVAIVVSAADLDVVNGVANNDVILEVTGGVATKRVVRRKGDVGKSIVSIAKTATVGIIDTYTITYSDATTTTFTVTNANEDVNKLIVNPLILPKNLTLGYMILYNSNNYTLYAGANFGMTEWIELPYSGTYKLNINNKKVRYILSDYPVKIDGANAFQDTSNFQFILNNDVKNNSVTFTTSKRFIQIAFDAPSADLVQDVLNSISIQKISTEDIYSTAIDALDYGAKIPNALIIPIFTKGANAYINSVNNFFSFAKSENYAFSGWIKVPYLGVYNIDTKGLGIEISQSKNPLSSNEPVVVADYVKNSGKVGKVTLNITQPYVCFTIGDLAITDTSEIVNILGISMECVKVVSDLRNTEDLRLYDRVAKKGNVLDLYTSKDGKSQRKFNYNFSLRQAVNYDNWGLMYVNDNNGIMASVPNTMLTRASEVEMAIMLNGEEFVGGYFHGYEFISKKVDESRDVEIWINGVKYAENQDFGGILKSFEMIQKSELFHYNSTAKFANVYKRWTYKNNKFTTSVRMEFLEAVNIRRCYLNMFPLYRKIGTTYLTSRAVNNDSDKIYIVEDGWDTTDANPFNLIDNVTNNADEMEQWGDYGLHFSQKVLASNKKPKGGMFISTNGGVYNKMYFEATGAYTTTVGESVYGKFSWEIIEM